MTTYLIRQAGITVTVFFTHAHNFQVWWFESYAGTMTFFEVRTLFWKIAYFVLVTQINFTNFESDFFTALWKSSSDEQNCWSEGSTTFKKTLILWNYSSKSKEESIFLSLSCWNTNLKVTRRRREVCSMKKSLCRNWSTFWMIKITSTSEILSVPCQREPHLENARKKKSKALMINLLQSINKLCRR